jgi:nitrate/nitrite-specific signal transduction histidine kinase
LAAYRIVQESLTNVARHANARRVQLSLRHTTDRVLVEVLDDGAGFTRLASAGSGLPGMRERAYQDRCPQRQQRVGLRRRAEVPIIILVPTCHDENSSGIVTR